MKDNIRNPIVTVAGHVDHGKTSILDRVRSTVVAAGEAGGITQRISFTLVPLENISKVCPAILEVKTKLEFTGFLFIDTPGHAAFSHHRKRGGSLADLAIVVIDINEGIMPQTQEVIELLKLNRTPFVVALNKLDNVSGWRKNSDNLKESIESQSTNVKLDFNEKMYTIIGALHHHGFNAKPYFEITNFSKELALVPCSARTGEGFNELTMMLCGLSQKFLINNLILGEEVKGVIIEVKKEKSMQYIEAILYDGRISAKDEIAIASFSEPILSKIRVLEEIMPVSSRFRPVNEAQAATGIRMQLVTSEGILPGMPFTVHKNDLEKIKKEFAKEVSEKIEKDKEGIIAKADSLGSLEALISMLREQKIKIVSAGIGNIMKKDIIQAEANNQTNPVNSVIVGFNVQEDEEISDIDKSSIKIIINKVIYKLIEDLNAFQKEKENEIKRERMLELATLGKIQILHQFVFRNSNPAIFGVRIESGKIKPHIPLIDEDGNEIAKVKGLQDKNRQLNEAITGMEIAISLPGINFDRTLSNKKFMFTDLTEKQYKKFKDNKDLLTAEEIGVLQKIAQIKRGSKPEWGLG